MANFKPGLSSCTDKAGSDTLKGPRWQKATTNYNIQILKHSSKSQTRGSAQEVTKGLLLAQSLCSFKFPLTEQEAVRSANLFIS